MACRPGCLCERCWCMLCGADLATHPPEPGCEHACPPPVAEPMGIVEFLESRFADYLKDHGL